MVRVAFFKGKSKRLNSKHKLYVCASLFRFESRHLFTISISIHHDMYTMYCTMVAHTVPWSTSIWQNTPHSHTRCIQHIQQLSAKIIPYVGMSTAVHIIHFISIDSITCACACMCVCREQFYKWWCHTY